MTSMSSQRSSLALATEPMHISSTVINQRPQRSCLTSSPSAPLVRRRLGPFSSRVMARHSQVATEGRRPRLLARALRGAPKAVRVGQSSAPNESQLLLAVMKATTTRRPMTPTRNMSLPLSMTSSASHGSLPIILRSLLRQPTQTTSTPSGISLKSAP
jgi:hypothetical protein